MKKVMGLLLFLCLLATVPAYAGGVASNTWILYDNFGSRIFDPFHNSKSAIIDPSKWYGLEDGSAIGRETQRMIISGQLNLSERAYGNTNSDYGLPYVQQKLYLAANPRNIRAIKATVNPVTFEAVGCAANPSRTWVAARLHAYFFNTSTTTPTTAINDVYAWIGVYRDSSFDEYSDNATVAVRVRQCLDDTCNTTTLLYSKNLGNTNNYRQTFLSMEWDKTSHTFIFMFNNKIDTYTYDTTKYPENFPSFYSGKRLDVYAEVPNCNITAPTIPRPTGYVNAVFDNVYIKTISP